MRFTILTIEAVLALLSVVGVVQRRWKALRLAIVLGWFGALPGFFFEFLASGLKRAPHPSVGEVARGIAPGTAGLLMAYLVFALPLFVLYCFGVGLVGGAVINRYTRPPAPRWAQPAAIVAAVIGASAPLAILFSEFLGAAIASAVFWVGFLLLARRWFFIYPETGQ